jgi:ubiquinone/menaquinone biosynthesis C-methylase UbiE
LKDILDLNKRAWDNIAKKYDDRTQQEISDIFIEFTRTLPEKGKVLDLGCGTGIPYTKISSRYISSRYWVQRHRR